MSTQIRVADGHVRKRRSGLTALLSLLFALTLAFVAPARMAVGAEAGASDHPENPGDVKVFKTATPVAGAVNTWDITLRIEGKNKPTTSDVVLVIDRSGSMSYRGDTRRINGAKAAAQAFVRALLPSDQVRIGVVSFAGDPARKLPDVSRDQELTNNARNLNKAISSINSSGGTNTQAGIHEAADMLANSTADNKYIVLLSDGMPTFSYGIRDGYERLFKYLGTASGVGIVYENPATGMPQNAYNYGVRVGDGTEQNQPIRTRGSWGRPTLTYSHANSAIAEAGFAGDKGINVFSIGLQMDSFGNDVMRQMPQGIGTFTDVRDTNQLTPVFQRIAGSIGSAVKNPQVTDEMGAGFEVTDEPISSVPSITDPASGATYERNDDGSISWNPGTLTTPVEGADDVMYAELTYRVKANDAVLNATQTRGKAGFYPTNSSATMSYTNVDNQKASETFPVPKANPTIVTVEKKLLDAAGKPITDSDKSFTVKIGDQDLTLKAGEKKAFVTFLTAGELQVSEDLGDQAKDFLEPQIVITDNTTGKTVSNPLKIASTPEKQDDFAIVVTNQYKATKVTATKKWENTPAASRPDVWFQLVQTDSKGTEANLGAPVKVGETGTITWTQNDDQLKSLVKYDATGKAYTYKVKEVNADGTDWAQAHPGYKSAVSDDGLTVTNTRQLVDFSWNKVDGAKNALAGSKWSVEFQPEGADEFQKLGEVVDNDGAAAGDAGQAGALTDSATAAGAFTLSGQQWGQYIVKETEAPAGFKISDKAQFGVVVTNGEAKYYALDGNKIDTSKPLTGDGLKFVNEAAYTPAIPFTGGVAAALFPVLGAVFAAGTALVFLLAWRRRHTA